MSGSDGQKKQGPQRGKGGAPEVTLGEYLAARMKVLQDMAPKHLDLKRLVKLAAAAWHRDSYLRQCSMDSIFLAVLRAAELGLEPNGATGEAYLVPYKVKDRYVCQCIVGWRGLLKLARQSGALSQVEAHVVHARDTFELAFGLHPVLRHVPALEEEPGDVRCVYALFRLKDGGTHVEVMTAAEVRRVQAGSKAYSDNSPWKQHWEEMARKTVVRRGAKYLELSSELASALALEDAAEAGDLPEAEVVEDAPTRGTAAVRAKVQALPTATGVRVDMAAERERVTANEAPEAVPAEPGAEG